MKWFYIGNFGVILFFALITIVSIYVIISIPGKWDNAVVIRICHDGAFIVRRADGTVWARPTWRRRAFRVEDEKTVCP